MALLLASLIAVGLSVGLIVAFRELFDRSNRLLKMMAAASFGAYILHPLDRCRAASRNDEPPAGRFCQVCHRVSAGDGDSFYHRVSGG
jgi:hypothetical protein